MEGRGIADTKVGSAVIDKNHKPLPHPFEGDRWERGLDPWHRDASLPQKGGWFLMDVFGNAIGFVAVGS